MAKLTSKQRKAMFAKKKPVADLLIIDNQTGKTLKKIPITQKQFDQKIKSTKYSFFCKSKT